MIGADISGKGKDNLNDMLAVISNPQAYSEKMAALQAAIAENKKYVELVAPASDIIKLRNDTRELVAKVRQEAEEIKAKATAEAQSVLDEAKSQAKAIVAKAQSEADDIKASVAGLQEQAQVSAAKVAQEALAAEKVKQDLQAKLDKQEALNADLQDAIDAAAKAEQSAQDLRKSIAEKHQAFIASL